MLDTITLTQLLAHLKKLAAEHGSQRKLARELGVSDAYLSDLLNRRRNPGDKILGAMNRRECEPRYEIIK